MTISETTKKMATFSERNPHDISHFLKVYTKTIGESEELDAQIQVILEMSAIVHDIARPLCCKKYGNTNGKYQKIQGAPLTSGF